MVKGSNNVDNCFTNDEVIVIDNSSNEVNEPLICKQNAKSWAALDAEFWAATMNLCKAILGATIMALPRTVYELGAAVSCLVFVTVAIFTYYSLYAILKGSYLSGRLTFSCVLESYIGRIGSVLLDLTQILDIVGILVLYLMIIGDILVGQDCQGLLYDWTGIDQSQWYLSRNFVLGMLCVIAIFPWLLFDRLDRISPVSFLGTFMIIFYTLTLAVVSLVARFRNIDHAPPLWPEKIQDQSAFVQMSSLIPIVVMALICHQNLLPILENLELPHNTSNGLRRRSLITVVAIVLCTTLFLISSICALVVFGDNINGDIMNNVTINGLSPIIGRTSAYVFASIIRTGFVINLTGSYLVNALPLRSILFKYFTYRSQHQSVPKWLFYSLTVIILGSSYMLAVSISSIWYVVKLIGAICANALAFLFPPLIMMCIARNNNKLQFSTFVFPIFLITIGLISGMSGLYSTATGMS